MDLLQDADPLRESECDPLWDDPLRVLADACLDGFTELARLEARSAALKVRLAADYAQATRALAPPTASAHDRSVQEMVIVSEVACALTVSEGAAAKLLGECRGPDSFAAADPERFAGRHDLLGPRPGHGG